jgi:hypothetical protein
MDITTKYNRVLGEINREIERFNSLLADFRFPLLDASAPGASKHQVVNETTG